MSLPKPPKSKWAAAMQDGQTKREAKAVKARKAAETATDAATTAVIAAMVATI